MGSEVCPFCGKSFKRLKAHLPHCKAKASPTPTQRHPENPSDDLVEPSKLTQAASPARVKKSKASVPLTSSSVMKPTDSGIASASSPSSSVSTKKKKRRLIDELNQLATQSPSSSSISPSSSPPPPPLPPSSSLSKPKKKAKEKASRSAAAVLSEPQEGSASSASLDLLSLATSDTLASTTSLLTQGDLTPQQDTNPKGISKKKKSQRQEKTPKASWTSVEDSEVEIVGGVVKVTSREDTGPKGPNTQDNKSLWATGGDDDPPTQSRITLQDVKASLGRSSNTSRSHKPGSILEQVQTSVLAADTRTKGPVSVDAVQSHSGLGHIDLDASRLLLPAQFSVTVSKAQEPGPEGHTAKSTSSSSVSLQHGPSSMLPPVPVPIPVVTLTERPDLSHKKVGLGEGGAPAGVPRPCPPQPPTPPAAGRTSEALVTAEPLLQINKADVVVNRIGGVLAERRLGQVKLRDVPAWLALKTPGRPAEVVDMLHGGWQWYYRKYIDVRKGGVGGVAMLLAGYCALSYMWSYPHIKRERWRKYH